jgi:hypothetical protein
MAIVATVITVAAVFAVSSLLVLRNDDGTSPAGPDRTPWQS